MAELPIASCHLKILQNFAICIESVLKQRSDRLRELRDLVKEWEAWDILRSLINYRSALRILFGFLKDIDSLGNWHAIAEEISEKLTQDVVAVFDQLPVILRDSETSKTFLSCREDSAQQLLDLIQELLDLFPNSTARPLLCKTLLRLARASELHPACFPLRDLHRIGQQVAAGAFGDVWKGLVRGHSVSVKVMRLFQDTDIKAILKEFGREALIWRQFSHPNLLPFYGIFYVENRLCLVSPWMENGHILRFLQHAPANTNRISLILDVALGLEYLHGQHVVHGDLKGMNVLVTPSGRACITDFGLSSIVDAMTVRFTYSTASARGGTARYQAPELLLGERSNHFGSDVYAFACVCYEIMTAKVPFFELPNDMAVSIKVIAGQRPSRPESAPDDDALWMLVQDCWEQSSEKRPAIKKIVQRLLGPQIAAESAQSATDWDETLSSKFRRSLQDSPLLPSVTEIERKVFGDEIVEACQECFPERLEREAPSKIHMGPRYVPAPAAMQLTRAPPSMEYPDPYTRDEDYDIFASGPSHWSPTDPRNRPFSGLNPDVTATIHLPEAAHLPRYRRVYTDAGAAMAARRRRKNPGKFVCIICGNEFTAKHNLKNHMNAHNRAPGAHTVTCANCGQRFGTKHVLARHARKCH